MTKAVSRDMALELFAGLLTNVKWGKLDPDRLQEFIGLPPEERGRRMTAFLKNGGRLEVKGPSVLSIDRSKPFDPEKFIGKGWSTLKEDKRALLLSNIDFMKVLFESGFAEGEISIRGEEKLDRLVSGGNILLDAKIGQALFEEEGQTTLRFIYDTYDIAWMEFVGTVLRRGDGRYFTHLGQDVDGSWHWGCSLLDYSRFDTLVSPLLASPETSKPIL